MGGMMQQRREKRAPVIKDVAALANVSVSTVSRYLNDSPKLSAESRQHIAHAIKLLDYHPSRIARGLVSSSMKSISILTSNTVLYGESNTIQGIEDEARYRNYSVGITKLDGESLDSLKSSITITMDQNPSGVIILKYDDLAAKALHLLPDNVTKVVIAGDYEKKFDQIDLCENQAGQQITEYLLSQGHETVYHVTIPGGGGGYSRTAGWEAALRAHGKPIPDVFNCSWSPSDARELGRSMSHIDGLTAVFGGNDEISMGLIRGLQDEGLSVPNDVSVVGFDDHPLSRVWNPALTTYRQDFSKAGHLAVQLLIERLEIKKSEDTILPARFIKQEGELIVRDSTAER